MTRDDIIRMAREAGVNTEPDIMDVMARFAALVAAAEREACAKVCDEFAKQIGENWSGDCADAIRARPFTS